MKRKIAKILTYIDFVWGLLIPVLFIAVEFEFFGIAALQYSDIFHVFVIGCFSFALAVPFTSVAALALSRKNLTLFTMIVNPSALAMSLLVIVWGYIGLMIAAGV